MIVKIAGWLYIVNGALAALPTLARPRGFLFFGAADLVSLILAGLFIAVGVGLLQRRPWGRWLALGSTFLAWTLGSLLYLAVLAFLVFAGGAELFFGNLFVINLILWAASIVISFMAFWYLCSEPGCTEFGVPYGSAGTVVASCATWVAIAIFPVANTAYARSMFEGMGRSSAAEARKAEHRRSEAERARRQEQARDARAAASLVEPEAEIESGLEAVQQEEADAAAPDESEGVAEPEVTTEETAMIPESPVPEPQAAPVDSADAAPPAADEPPSSRKILKCRDASGGITFTQGYCPSGSKQVAMPNDE